MYFNRQYGPERALKKTDISIKDQNGPPEDYW